MQKALFVQKFKALLLHVGVSTVLVAILLTACLFFWYPGMYRSFGLEGGIVIVLGVDLVLGPLLTFVLFDTQKKSLKYELSAVVAVQLIAYAYGVWALYSQRPYIHLVTHKGLHIIAYDDFNQYGKGWSGLADKGYAGPEKFFMYLPKDKKEIDTIVFASEFVDLKPFVARLDLYRKIADDKDLVLNYFLSLHDKTGGETCVSVPVESKHYFGNACIDRKTTEIIKLTN